MKRSIDENEEEKNKKRKNVLSNEYQDLLLEAILSGYSIENLSEELKNNSELALKLIKTDRNYFKYLISISEELKNNHEFILESVKINGNFLRIVPQKYKDDFEIVFAAVGNKPECILYASDNLKNNYDIVMESVKKNGSLLNDVSNELKNNYNIVLEAVKNDGSSLVYASKKLQNNIHIVTMAVEKYGWSLANASYELQSNFELIRLALIYLEKNSNECVSNYFFERLKYKNKYFVYQYYTPYNQYVKKLMNYIDCNISKTKNNFIKFGDHDILFIFKYKFNKTNFILYFY
jgi:hypothetical protein